MAPYSSKIRQFIIQERLNKLIYGINTIIKSGTWQPDKFRLCWGFMAQSTQWGHVERGQFT